MAVNIKAMRPPLEMQICGCCVLSGGQSGLSVTFSVMRCIWIEELEEERGFQCIFTPLGHGEA